ncbi:hypothetical protein DASC09_028660 [Saccharomycopsis crataegensis]|uniref:Uncharacterized protein n=1 Tax=Saccharomycopsis crataegensis TaxID=43959 RepID=A0AAV5QLM0_9ASCO|nr:hypothetical protein DASC09_028660 [Saccharomycopsis crataegensis]
MSIVIIEGYDQSQQCTSCVTPQIWIWRHHRMKSSWKRQINAYKPCILTLLYAILTLSEPSKNMNNSQNNSSGKFPGQHKRSRSELSQFNSYNCSNNPITMDQNNLQYSNPNITNPKCLYLFSLSPTADIRVVDECDFNEMMNQYNGATSLREEPQSRHTRVTSHPSSKLKRESADTDFEMILDDDAEFSNVFAASAFEVREAFTDNVMMSMAPETPIDGYFSNKNPQNHYIYNFEGEERAIINMAATKSVMTTSNINKVIAQQYQTKNTSQNRSKKEVIQSLKLNTKESVQKEPRFTPSLSGSDFSSIFDKGK